MSVLFILLTVVVAFASLIALLYTLFTVWYRNGGEAVEAKSCDGPRVSILVPLRNADDGLDLNLESMFRVDYRDKEILFAVDSLKDPVVDVIERVAGRFSGIPSRIVPTGHSVTENPKIHKLAVLEYHASGKLLWVLDSNVRVDPSVLARLVSEYHNRSAKLVFSPIRATGSTTLGSLVENAYINHFVSGNVIGGWKLFRQKVIVGKSMLIEAATLGRFGGFGYFRHYLAEDFMMGEAFSNSRFPVSTNCTWVTNVNHTSSIAHFVSRMTRWAKLRFHLKPCFYPFEIFSNPVALSLLFPLLGGSAGWLWLAAVFGFKIGVELINFLAVNRGDSRKIALLMLFPCTVVVKDLLLLAVFFAPFFSRTVKWRGGHISIGQKTLITPNQEFLLLKEA